MVVDYTERNGAVEPGIITKFNVTQVLNIPEFEGMAYYIMNENDDISILSSVYHREAIRYERTKEEFNIHFVLNLWCFRLIKLLFCNSGI